MARRIRLRQPNANVSVIAEPLGTPIAPLGDYIFNFATVADELPAWGTNIMGRDRELRRFWPSEPLTASAVYSVCSKYAGFEWALEGPPRTVGIYQDILQNVEFGEGWIRFVMKVLNDLLTQDNGAFIEIVRTDDSPMAPCLTLNHLDSGRCVRTGHRDEPVVYYDRMGGAHLMKWYQVVHLAEFPSPIELLRGIQVCAISRLLRAAQIMRDISIYKREKISGRFVRGLYLVSGVQQRTIDLALRNQGNEADASGLTRYIQPMVVASLDPGATVKVDSIEFAKLPDNFDEAEAMRWYVAQLALAFGGDYQDFAPLPGGNLGSGQQSRMLHQKSLGKGSRLFMKLIEHIMNYRGIIPNNIRFRFVETDSSEDSANADLSLTRAKERQIRILSGEITLAVARQIAADNGDLDYDYMYQMNEAPVTDTVSLDQSDPFDAEDEVENIGDPSAYHGTPEDQIIPNMHGTFGAAPTGVPASSNTASPAKPAAQGTEKPGANKALGNGYAPAGFDHLLHSNNGGNNGKVGYAPGEAGTLGKPVTYPPKYGGKGAYVTTKPKKTGRRKPVLMNAGVASEASPY